MTYFEIVFPSQESGLSGTSRTVELFSTPFFSFLISNAQKNRKERNCADGISTLVRVQIAATPQQTPEFPFLHKTVLKTNRDTSPQPLLVDLVYFA